MGKQIPNWALFIPAELLFFDLNALLASSASPPCCALAPVKAGQCCEDVAECCWSGTSAFLLLLELIVGTSVADYIDLDGSDQGRCSSLLLRK